MEKIFYGNMSFEVPSAICNDVPILLNIISPDTWNNFLSDEHRESLMKFLPDFPENDLEEKTRTLEMFFMNVNFFFDTPIQFFLNEFRAGHFNSDVVKLRKIHKKILRKTYRYRQKQYYHNLLEEVLVRRKHYLESSELFLPNEVHIPKHLNLMSSPTPESSFKRAKKRYFREMLSIKADAECESDLSEDDDFGDCLGFSLSKKRRRQLFLLESSFPSHLNLVKGTHTRGSLALDLERRIGPSNNPLELSDEHINSLVLAHFDRRKTRDKTVSLDTRGITLEAVLERSQMVSKRPHRPVLNKNSNSEKIKSKHTNREKPEDVNSHEYFSHHSPTVFEDKSTSNELEQSASSGDESCNKGESLSEVLPGSPSFEDGVSISTELNHETHSSFFSLLRDLICSYSNQRITRGQLETNIRSWQDSAISSLNDWFTICQNWTEILVTAVNFLCGSASADLLPADFVPFIEHKSALNYFQWIGAGRDSDPNLEPLYQFWINVSTSFSFDWPTSSPIFEEEEESHAMSKAPPVTWDTQQTTLNEGSHYHGQERTRYGHPHRAHTFRTHGYESVVGPVKGIYNELNKSGCKAREHTLLVSSRPPFVTILSLVRDAVSRLPNGEGTKGEICELLKESQFLVPMTEGGMESTLNSVVSGALDRLQNGKDPCVKFEATRKCWIYLHRGKSEEELERMHHMNKPHTESAASKLQNLSQNVRKTPKGKSKEEAAANPPPPNVAMEPCTKAIKQMDGSAIKVKDEDLLKNWVKIAGKPKKTIQEKLANQSIKPALPIIKESPLTLSANGSMMRIINAGIQQTVASVGKKKDGDKITGLTKSDAVKLPISEDVVVPKKMISFVGAKCISGTAKVIATQQVSRKIQTGFISGQSKLAPTVTSVVQGMKGKTDLTQTSGNELSQGSIKVLQCSAANMQVPKGGIVTTTGGTTSLLLDSSSGVQTLLGGQKLVLSGNRVLLQGGKVVGSTGGNLVAAGKNIKQYVTGVMPGHQLVALTTQKNLSPGSGGQEGRLVQIAVDSGTSAIPSGFQKVALLPQFATSQVGAQTSKNISTVATTKGRTMTTNEIKLKLASPNFTTGNLITLGGKQIILATKGNVQGNQNQIRQIVTLAPDSTSSESNKTSVEVTQGQVILPSSSTSQQGGSHINLKRLQALHSFKVVNAHQVQNKKGGPLVAHLVPSGQNPSKGTITTKGIIARPANVSQQPPQKKNPP